MYVRLFILSAVLLISACSPKTEVTFTPSRGDEHQYWTYSDITVSGYGTVQTSSMLQHYKVTDTAPLTLDITAKYMDIGAAGGHHITSTHLTKRDEKIQRLFEKGFEITLDPDTGSLENFRGLDEELWTQMLKDGGARLVEMLKKSMLSPGVLKSIPAKVGSKINLTGFADQRVTLTVASVSDTQVITTISAEDGQSGTHIYGEMALNRDDGWLNQLLMVVDQPMPSVKKGATMHMRLAMLPTDKPTDFHFNDFEPYTDWFDTTSAPEDLSLLDPQSGEQLLAYDTGFMNANARDLLLVLPEQVQKQRPSPDTRLRNIHALDATGQKLPLEFSWLNAESAYSDQLSAVHHVQALGWNDIDIYKKIASFTADVDYYPVHFYGKTINWQAGTQTFEFHGVKVKITADANEPHLFTITSERTINAALCKFFGGLNGQMQIVDAPPAEPWMSYGDSMMFDVLGLIKHSETFKLKLNELPQQATFYVVEYTDQPAFTKSVKFLNLDQYREDPNLPPSGQMLLYDDDGANDDTTQVDFDGLQAQADTTQGSKITLPVDWDSICQLSVIKGAEQQGHTLKWMPVDKDSYGGNTMANRYHLSTEDGIRHYFYGIEVTSEIRCNGQPAWQKVAYQANDKPWLVPVSAFGKIDLNQSVSEFINHFQLLNEDNKPLRLLGHDGRLVADPQTTAVKDILTKAQQLRVAGKVLALRKLSVSGEPITRQWTQTFPPLP